MDERTGLFRESERKLIDGHAGKPDITAAIEGGVGQFAVAHDELTQDEQRAMLEEVDEKRVKSVLKNDRAQAGRIREHLHSVFLDLWRVRNFYYEVREQPAGRREWQERVYPAIKPELENIASLTNEWGVFSGEGANTEEVRDQLLQSVETPLRTDLEAIQRPSEREDELEAYAKKVKGADDVPDAFAADFEELDKRHEVLLSLLRDDEYRDVFEFIVDNPGSKLPDRKKGGNPWKWWASRMLETRDGVIQESGWGFELTPRGEAIHEAIKALMSTDCVQQMAETRDISASEAASKHLAYFNWEKA